MVLDDHVWTDPAHPGTRVRSLSLHSTAQSHRKYRGAVGHLAVGVCTMYVCDCIDHSLIHYQICRTAFE